MNKPTPDGRPLNEQEEWIRKRLYQLLNSEMGDIELETVFKIMFGIVVGMAVEIGTNYANSIDDIEKGFVKGAKFFFDQNREGLKGQTMQEAGYTTQ